MVAQWFCPTWGVLQQPTIGISWLTTPPPTSSCNPPPWNQVITYWLSRAGTTHSMISAGACKQCAICKVAGRVAALVSNPPSCLPALLYGWHAIPAITVAGSGQTSWILAAVVTSVMSAVKTGTDGCRLRCKSASFGWSSTAHFWTKPAWVKPKAENPPPNMKKYHACKYQSTSSSPFISSVQACAVLWALQLHSWCEVAAVVEHQFWQYVVLRLRCTCLQKAFLHSTAARSSK